MGHLGKNGPVSREQTGLYRQNKGKVEVKRKECKYLSVSYFEDLCYGLNYIPPTPRAPQNKQTNKKIHIYTEVIKLK